MSFISWLNMVLACRCGLCNILFLCSCAVRPRDENVLAVYLLRQPLSRPLLRARLQRNTTLTLQRAGIQYATTYV